MNYELAKKLKDAGFPQIGAGMYICDESVLPLNFKPGEVINLIGSKPICYLPTLSELIEACGDDLRLQSYYCENNLMWQADTCCRFQDWDSNIHKSAFGSTPEEAVANLWLELNNK